MRPPVSSRSSARTMSAPRVWLTQSPEFILNSSLIRGPKKNLRKFCGFPMKQIWRSSLVAVARNLAGEIRHRVRI